MEFLLLKQSRNPNARMQNATKQPKSTKPFDSLKLKTTFNRFIYTTVFIPFTNLTWNCLDSDSLSKYYGEYFLLLNFNLIHSILKILWQPLFQTLNTSPNLCVIFIIDFNTLEQQIDFWNILTNTRTFLRKTFSCLLQSPQDICDGIKKVPVSQLF